MTATTLRRLQAMLQAFGDLADTHDDACEYALADAARARVDDIRASIDTLREESFHRRAAIALPQLVRM